jgi:hypothetical protein
VAEPLPALAPQFTPIHDTSAPADHVHDDASVTLVVDAKAAALAN